MRLACAVRSVTTFAPAISPKKTWEGFAGSVAAAVIAGVLLSIFMLHQPWWVGVILAVIVVILVVGVAIEAGLFGPLEKRLLRSRGLGTS